MKIVHISTSRKGGAGISAFRIHLALLKNGIDSYFLSLDNNADLKCFEQFNKQKNRSRKNILVDKLKWRLKHHFNIIQDKRELYNDRLKRMFADLTCEMASLPFSEYDVLKHPAVQNADIIHLHWVAGMLDYPSFFKHNTKPIVWTLHDMNPFQGLFHYKEDEIRNKAISFRFNARLLRIKQRAIKKSKHLIKVVCPSQWLLETAIQSDLFKGLPGYCIAYPLDTDIFYPIEKESLRKAMNIPSSNCVFLFVSQSVNNYRKGFDLLIDALTKMKTQAITLLVIGEQDSISILGLDIKVIGTITDDEKLRSYYSVADAFIIPSREDNLPNVMLEAMACGTPVLSFDVGGMAKIIRNGFNGLKAPEVNSDSLAKILFDFIRMKNQFDSGEIRKFALETFSEKSIVSEYWALYNNKQII